LLAAKIIQNIISVGSRGWSCCGGKMARPSGDSSEIRKFDFSWKIRIKPCHLIFGIVHYLSSFVSKKIVQFTARGIGSSAIERNRELSDRKKKRDRNPPQIDF
jgi:hypothetical protein